jgi:NADH:ubiquinone oxidoreductase subunit 6 (subunit J)
MRRLKVRVIVIYGGSVLMAGTTAVMMADVLQRIAKEEHERVEKNGAAALQVKPGAFLIAGIEIQENQCVAFSYSAYRVINVEKQRGCNAGSQAP